MKLPVLSGTHSSETMQRLKQAALPTHDEDFAAPDGVSRRSLLKMFMGASAALAVGVTGCERKPRRKIISRVDGPEYFKPGKALYYSSTWTDGAHPYGVIIKTVDGRPIKIEGNPDHPLNAGATSAAMQASLLALYDPDRLRGPQRDGQAIGWNAVDQEVSAALKAASSVAVLTRSTLGPAEQALIAKLCQVKPGVRHLVHESVHDGPRRSAWQVVYGQDGRLVPRYDRAEVILGLDCDFLATDGPALESVRRFLERRRLYDQDHQHAAMSRLYAVESALSLTGSNADHRVRLRPSVMARLASAIRSALGGQAEALHRLAEQQHLPAATLDALVADLQAHSGQALVVAGGHLPASVHAAVALLNDALGAAGATLEWDPMPDSLPVSSADELSVALNDGVDVLICLGVNPVHDWPGGGFAEVLKKAKLAIGHGLHLDETLTACTLQLPSDHSLESWNDAAPRSGMHTLCQPVIAPLFDTRQEAESLLIWTQALAGENDPLRQHEDWHAFLQAHWRASGTGLDWEEALRLGGRLAAKPAGTPACDRAAAERLTAGASAASGEYELVLLPHHAVHDGRLANNGWLQELPEPISKLVWDNAAAMSQRTAEKLGVAEGELVSVSVGDAAIQVPALIQTGTADGVLALTLGHGRTGGGRIAIEAGGTNVAPLLGQMDAETPRVAFNAKLDKASGSRRLVRTQKQFSMQDRPIALDGTLDEYRHEAGFVKHKRHLPEMVDLYEPVDYSRGHKWGMAIDLTACIGCEGCMAACQAENNIPVVGRDQCSLGREMHWLRIDRYHDGEDDDLAVHHQPMLCQHCDNAPCENVCPVNATVHSPEGLNEMVYNRCVGTRYCANNCPYKVRRFNFLRYQEKQLHDPVQELAHNPQVTVRGVGVMEKCTFCVQRINAARFAAASKGETVQDGAVQTACEQACPASAIVFGDLNDPESAVSKARASARGYHVLEELNIKPNVTYLARVRNPHPDLVSEPAVHDGH